MFVMRGLGRFAAPVAVAAFALIGAPASALTIFQPSSASWNTSDLVFSSDPIHLRDQSGLNVNPPFPDDYDPTDPTDQGFVAPSGSVYQGYQSGVDDYEDYLALNPLHLCECEVNDDAAADGERDSQDLRFEDGTVINATLEAGAISNPGEDVVLTFGFGSKLNIGALAIWNEDGLGLESFTLEWLNLDTNTFEEVGSFDIIGPRDGGYPLFEDYGPQSFTFASVMTNTLRLRMTGDGSIGSNPDCLSDSQQNGVALFCAIGEIAVGATAVPVPAALPLMLTGLGMIGFLGWRRRQA